MVLFVAEHGLRGKSRRLAPTSAPIFAVKSNAFPILVNRNDCPTSNTRTSFVSLALRHSKNYERSSPHAHSFSAFRRNRSVAFAACLLSRCCHVPGKPAAYRRLRRDRDFCIQQGQVEVSYGRDGDLFSYATRYPSLCRPNTPHSHSPY